MKYYANILQKPKNQKVKEPSPENKFQKINLPPKSHEGEK